MTIEKASKIVNSICSGACIRNNCPLNYSIQVCGHYSNVCIVVTRIMLPKDEEEIICKNITNALLHADPVFMERILSEQRYKSVEMILEETDKPKLA